MSKVYRQNSQKQARMPSGPGQRLDGSVSPQDGRVAQAPRLESDVKHERRKRGVRLVGGTSPCRAPSEARSLSCGMRPFLRRCRECQQVWRRLRNPKAVWSDCEIKRPKRGCHSFADSNVPGASFRVELVPCSELRPPLNLSRGRYRLWQSAAKERRETRRRRTPHRRDVTIVFCSSKTCLSFIRNN